MAANRHISTADALAAFASAPGGVPAAAAPPGGEVTALSLRQLLSLELVPDGAPAGRLGALLDDAGAVAAERRGELCLACPTGRLRGALARHCQGESRRLEAVAGGLPARLELGRPVLGFRRITCSHLARYTVAIEVNPRVVAAFTATFLTAADLLRCWTDAEVRRRYPGGAMWLEECAVRAVAPAAWWRGWLPPGKARQADRPVGKEGRKGSFDEANQVATKDAATGQGSAGVVVPRQAGAGAWAGGQGKVLEGGLVSADYSTPGEVADAAIKEILKEEVALRKIPPLEVPDFMRTTKEKEETLVDLGVDTLVDLGEEVLGKESIPSVEQPLSKESLSTLGAAGHRRYLVALVGRKARGLECPVCLEQAAAPIFGCPQQFHTLCAACRTRGLHTCPTCRLPYGKEGPVRNRFAEELAEEVASLREELAKVPV